MLQPNFITSSSNQWLMPNPIALLYGIQLPASRQLVHQWRFQTLMKNSIDFVFAAKL